MPRPGHPTKDEWRARQATNSDKFYSTNLEYNQLYTLIHNENTSAADCTKPFVDRTIELAASPDSEREIDRFVSVFAAAIVELGARTAYGNSDIQSKLVDFVHELQKAVVTDPNSTTGEPLSYCEEQESRIWTDLPMFRLWCSEEMISFEVEDPTNTPREVERWKNLSAFWAGLSRSESTDFVRHGLSAFLDAFGPHDSPKEARPSLFLQHIACIWFIYAADTLWLCCQEGTENRNRESWVYWKKATEGLKDVDGDTETQSLVNQALAAIERAEQGV